MINDSRLTNITQNQDYVMTFNHCLKDNLFEVVFGGAWAKARKGLPEGRWFMWHPLTWPHVINPEVRLERN